ncbi:hypothetical protein RKD45_006329 [Streptomyces griseus]|nr:hypothetical protein [Streptomyces pratensis]
MMLLLQGTVYAIPLPSDVMRLRLSAPDTT